MNEKRILIALDQIERRSFLPGRLFESFEDLADCVRCFDTEKGTGEDYFQVLAEFQPDAVVACWSAPRLPDDLLEITDGRTRYLCALGGTVRGLVSERLIRQGLLVSNWGGSISRVVAECGLMMIIASLRRVNQWALRLHVQKAWKQRGEQTDSLFGKRVGIHGFGAVARALVTQLAVFKTPISSYAPGVPRSLLEEFGVNQVESLERLFAESDIVVELEALTEERRGMVREEHFRSLPDGGVFVNIGRGPLVDQAGLERVAQEGRIQVALDVYGSEPLAEDSPLRGLPNVLLLPHVAGPTMDRRRDAGEQGLENARRYFANEPLLSPVTLEVYERST